MSNPQESKSCEELTNDDRHIIKYIIKKLSVADQLGIYQGYQLLPKACTELWCSLHKRLDFRTIEEHLSGEELGYFLTSMVDNFKYIYFTANRLQDNLNVLEKSGVKILNNVQHCELLLHNEREGRHQGNGDSSDSPVVAQWPLHALPKLLRNLRRLKVYCDVQVHFIEQFSHLELLLLHGEVAQSALTGILERCTKLKRLFLKSNNAALNIRNISRCLGLQDISVPVVIFSRAREQIVKLPDLQLIELTSNEHHAELSVDCLRYVMQHKAADVEILQLDCSCFNSPYWIRDAELSRCERMRGLVLINCRFNEREISELKMPRIQRYLVFSGCHDLKEYQLLDFVKLCPGLYELYIIDCPLLSGKVLHDIYRIRRSENLDVPLIVVISRCDAIRNEYQKMYSNYWYFKQKIIRLERMSEENHHIEDIQLFFYKNY